MPGDPNLNQITRTHLANERTFLAYMRTAISMVALGIGVAAFLEETGETARIALAVSATLAGVAVLLVGFHRYRVMRTQIARDIAYQPNTRAAAVSTVLVVAVACAAAAIIVIQR